LSSELFFKLCDVAYSMVRQMAVPVQIWGTPWPEGAGIS